LIAGCATAPPTAALSSASAAIGAAEEAGAETASTAQPVLRRAQAQLEQARAAMDAGDQETASGLLIRAQADADLAASLARQEHLRSQAAELSRHVEALRNETRF
jgi:hypothetical protein